MTDTLSRPSSSGPEGLTPPQALEAERSVLAAMMLDNEAIGRAIEMIPGAETFYRTAHQKIFDAIIALYNRSEKADLITLAEELRKRNDLEAVGGTPALSQILDYATTTANLEFHAKIIMSKAVLRALIRASGEIQHESYAGSDETGAILDRAEQRIFAITDKRVRQGFVALKDLLTPAFEDIQKLYERKVHVTGVPSGYDDIDKMTAGFQPGDLVIIAGRPSMGKCVSWRTLVDDPDTGERLTIEQFVRERRKNVLGLSECGRVRAAAVSDWVDNGVQSCFRVTTRLGRSIEVTARHPFRTIHGWVPLQALGVGDRIGVARTVPTFGADESWSLDRVRLLAYFIAEGGLTGTTPYFTNSDTSILVDFFQALEREFPECDMKQSGKPITYRISRRPWLQSRKRGENFNPVTIWLTELALMGKHSRKKRLPDVVWKWNREFGAEFLRTLFSCDGTVYSMCGKPRIEYTVASELLARDVHHLLCRFGIVAKFWQKTTHSWRVEITEPDAVKRYYSEVGWFGEKADRFVSPEFLPEPRCPGGNTGHAPKVAWELVRASAAQRGINLTEMARAAGEPVGRGFNLHSSRGIPRRRLAAYAEVLDDTQLRLASSVDLYWDEIISIEPIGKLRVYDITVPDGANFIAEDICLHNSSLAVNIAENAAIRHNVPCAIFSLEMSKEQLVLRLLCSQSEVALHKVRNGYLGQEDWPRLTTGAGLLTQAPIMIDDSAAPTLLEIRAKCRRLRAEGKLGLVVVDYLQLIRTSSQAENRVQEISQISRGLKALAKELNIPIIALSQLSRAVEQRHGGDKRPQLSDLRESGSIEQDSDLVMMVFREEYYKPDAPELRGKATIIIAKQRNGPTGSIDLTFLREFTKFVPYSPMMPDESEPAF